MLELPQKVYANILEHAHAALPGEAVGILGGRDARAEIAIALPNVAQGRAFLADPRAQFHAERKLHEMGLQLIAVYHSHPDGGLALSESDLTFARKRSCVQVVIVLPSDTSTGALIGAFRVCEEAVSSVKIEIS